MVENLPFGHAQLHVQDELIISEHTKELNVCGIRPKAHLDQFSQ